MAASGRWWGRRTPMQDRSNYLQPQDGLGDDGDMSNSLTRTAQVWKQSDTDNVQQVCKYTLSR